MRLTTDARDHQKLKEQYAETLRGLLKEKTPSYGRCGGIRHLLDLTAIRPVLIHRPGTGRTWVWSDLHLGDTEVMKYCRRPFGAADAMDRAIMAAWRAAVGPGDTVLNGGDVALPGALGGMRRTAVREAPGRKLLVVGNHDFNPRSGLLDAADHDAWTGVLVIETDPPIVMTHVPLDVVPPGWVNVHGHLHNHAPPGDTPHINVCIEHTDYRPLRLESLAELAKRLIAGKVPGGATTAERIRNADAPPLGRSVVRDRKPRAHRASAHRAAAQPWPPASSG